jgi:hypothetical protein
MSNKQTSSFSSTSLLSAPSRASLGPKISPLSETSENGIGLLVPAARFPPLVLRPGGKGRNEESGLGRAIPDADCSSPRPPKLTGRSIILRLDRGRGEDRPRPDLGVVCSAAAPPTLVLERLPDDVVEDVPGSRRIWDMVRVRGGGAAMLIMKMYIRGR